MAEPKKPSDGRDPARPTARPGEEPQSPANARSEVRPAPDSGDEQRATTGLRDDARPAADLRPDAQPTASLRGDPQTSSAGATTLSPGLTIGRRYRIGDLLGRGGMGEVWHAIDLKLRVDVALKAILAERFSDPRALDLLRREVRSAREVISPNVCRIFDLVEVDGQEMVSMEFIDGTTLVDVFRKDGPLGLRRAGEIASQLLSGLAAIHQAGLVHRDVKPENIMLTRSGRVVLMDFGLAKPEADRAASLAGTPAYMAPEQLRGDVVDPRTDLFATGIVLAEMLSCTGTRESREAIQRGVHEDPARLPHTPWRPVLLKSVTQKPADRYPSASAFTRALEEVTLRVEGAEDLHPYPGLASFTAADAEYFFGREAEIETVWAKLRRPHLLALIGPSGAGKSSFLRAGLIPTMPDGWQAVVCTPGSRPFTALADVLVPEFAGDTEAMHQLVRFDDLEVAVNVFRRWRQGGEEALLVVDQFEELFTLNPPEVQSRFAELLGRLALEADVHVFLSMRDDFLFHIHQYPVLLPILSELTLLGPPTGAALRRALVQPALKCGYRFEDDALVDDMLAEVADERGALPLLAFAVARQWEQRDRQTGLLTRAVHDALGGVGGALAQHAETTLERIGEERLPLVRELFRNLVTAQGTRAAREWDELLSVFEAGEREAADAVLRELVDARLLTSFEERQDEMVSGAENDGGANGPRQAATRRRVEIIHESLLTAWPRLVRWQTQDTEGAQLRDQLRQSAQMWEERSRAEDLLWSGSVYKEYTLWRERYPGGLTDTEEAFAEAMTTRAGRQRRRRRTAVGVMFAFLLGVVGVVSTLWWQAGIARDRAEAAQQEAVAEARRAEASQLFALGQLEIDADPTRALAYAIASLERRDNPVTRRFALEALWRGPTRIALPGSPAAAAGDFSPDGRWLAVGELRSGEIKLWRRDGGNPTEVGPQQPGAYFLRFSQQSDSFFSLGTGAGGVGVTARFWSLPEGEALQTLSIESPQAEMLFLPFVSGESLVTGVTEDAAFSRFRVQAWPLDGGDPRLLARFEQPGLGFGGSLDREHRWLAYGQGKNVYVTRFDELATATPRRLGSHDGIVKRVNLDGQGERLVSADEADEVRLWSRTSDTGAPLRVLPGRAPGLAYWWDSTGRRVGSASGFWDLAGPPDADPIPLRAGRSARQAFLLVFHPHEPWLLTTGGAAAIWPLSHPYPYVLRGHTSVVTALAFAPDGSWLASASGDGTMRIWPLSPEAGQRGRVVSRTGSGEGAWASLAVDPEGRHLLATTENSGSKLFLVSLESGGRTQLGDTFRAGAVASPAFDPSGRLAAVGGGGRQSPTDSVVRIWDVETGEMIQVLDAGDGKPVGGLRFRPDGKLLAKSGRDLLLWNLEDGSHRVLMEDVGGGALSRDCRYVLAIKRHAGAPGSGKWQGIVHDLESGNTRPVPWLEKGILPASAALDPTGTIAVVGDPTGAIHAAPVTAESSHLLLGHEGRIWSITVSPDGRWIASGSADGTIRLWAMPEGTPFHTLPHEEFLARLRTLTNLRAVENDQSPSGYGVAGSGEFAGWETLPTW